MPSKYFNNSNENQPHERNLLLDCVDEVIDIGGIEVSYLQRDTFNTDGVLGTADFNYPSAAKLTVMILGGDWDDASFEFSNFGFKPVSKIQYLISKRKWYEKFSVEPQEGDVVYTSHNDEHLKISWVDDNYTSDNSGDFLFGKNTVFRLVCEHTPLSDLFNTNIDVSADPILNPPSGNYDILSIDMEQEYDAISADLDNEAVLTQDAVDFIDNTNSPFFRN